MWELWEHVVAIFLTITSLSDTVCGKSIKCKTNKQTNSSLR